MIYVFWQTEKSSSLVCLTSEDTEGTWRSECPSSSKSRTSGFRESWQEDGLNVCNAKSAISGNQTLKVMFLDSKIEKVK